MRAFKKRLALVLAALMLVSTLPTAAFAEDNTGQEDASPETQTISAEEVTYNTGDISFTVGTEEVAMPEEPDEDADDDALEAYNNDMIRWATYRYFEEDGSYTISLEDNAQFPYGVQFTCEDETQVTWFRGPRDTVTIGGHSFFVASEGVDADVWEENVDGLTKEFTNDGLIDYLTEWMSKYRSDLDSATMSLLPLKEVRATIDYTGYFPDELKAVPLTDLCAKINEVVEEEDQIDAEHIQVWAKWAYRDEDGDYISENTDYVILGETSTIDLSYNGNYGNDYRLELIVGENADQFNAENVRYLLTVDVDFDFDDVIQFYVADENQQAITIYDSYYYGHRYYYNGHLYYERYSLGVDPDAWTGGQTYLRMELDEAYGDALTATVYEGYYETAEAAVAASAADITATVWGQQSAGYLADYSNFREMLSFTVVIRRGDAVVLVLPFGVYMYSDDVELRLNYLFKDSGSGSDTYRSSLVWYRHSWSDESDEELYTYTMPSGDYAADGQYYLSMDIYDPSGSDRGGTNGINFVEKAVVGSYSTIAEADAAGATDIKEQLFGDVYTTGGYQADYSGGVTFTIFLTNDAIYHYTVKTEAYVPVEETLNSGTYFSVDWVYDSQNVRYFSAFELPEEDDSYYQNGFRTIFMLNSDGSPVSDEYIVPQFSKSTGATVYAATNKASTGDTPQESGETQVYFISGDAVLYTVTSEDGENSQNYWVTYVTQQTGGAKLYVNGTNVESMKEDDVPVREVFLTDEYDNHHDILIANIGDEELTGLTVELRDAQNIKLDDYWTVQDGSAATLAAFTTTKERDADGNWVSRGQLPNLAKIRLLPVTDENGNRVDGAISGTLVIHSDNGGTVEIKLTGIAGDPQILTTELMDGVKYVPYSNVVQTNSMYSNSVSLAFEKEGNLPEGVTLKPNGEIYGVPKETGEFPITVTVTATYSPKYSMMYVGRENWTWTDTASYTLTVLDNTDENVWNATDENYDIIQAIPNSDGTMTIDLMDIKDNRWQNQTQLLWSKGEFENFVALWLGGEQLVLDTDYTKDAGSTKLTIQTQALAKAGLGSHTIAAEFREGDHETGTLKRSAQNYKITSLSSDDSSDSDSSSSSSSSKKPTVDKTPETVVTPTVPENVVTTLDVNVSGTTATLSAISADNKSALEASSKPYAQVDLSGAASPVNAMVLPTSVVDDLAKAFSGSKSETGTFEIKFADGTILLDERVMAAIAAQSNGEDIQLSVEAIGTDALNQNQLDALNGATVYGGIRLNLAHGDSAISNFGGGRVTVQIPFTVPADSNARGFAVWNLKEDGGKRLHSTSYEDGAVTFRVAHFSDYVITYEGVSDFTDVTDGAWYASMVDYAQRSGLMDGVGGNSFAPDMKLTRAMFAQILYSLDDSAQAGAAGQFSDVPDGMWYTDAVNWAAEAGIVSGTGDGKYSPDSVITREQLFTMLYSYAQRKGYDTSAQAQLTRFTDASQVSDWASSALSWSVAYKLLSGMEDGTIAAGNAATRAQTATILTMFLESYDQ